MNLGTVLIVVALLISIMELFFSGKGLLLDRVQDFTLAKRLYYLSLTVISLSILHLLLLFILNDFSNQYVYSNSSVSLPVVYKISALWSGQEGSFLVWVFLLSVIGFIALQWDRKNAPLIMPFIVLTKLFIFIALLVKNPFDYIWHQSPELFGVIPADGMGMNPLLQDPWMISHPPILYIGYAASAIPFAYAFAAYLKNEPSLMIDKSYPWILLSFTTLGLGIFLGGFWAYKVLGWGGFWGWDPVENSSLIPWLFVTALFHGILIQKRSNALIKTNLILSCCFFILVFLSFFLTRSGILANYSVHSFGESGLSIYLLSYVIFFTVLSSAVFIIKYNKIQAAPLPPGIWNNFSLIALGMLLIILFSLFILFGTLMPVLSDIFMQRPTSADSGFYTSISYVFGPCIITLILLSTLRNRKVLTVQNIVFLIISIAFSLFIVYGTQLRVQYLFLAMPSIFLILLNTFDLITRRSIRLAAFRIAHTGVALFVVGTLVSEVYSTIDQSRLVKGVEQNVNGIAFSLLGVDTSDSDNIKFKIRSNDTTDIISMKYKFSERMNSIYREPYIKSGITGDIYIYPDDYQSGFEKASIVRLEKGIGKTFGKSYVLFKEFETKNMTSDNPVINAKIIIDGLEVIPSYNFKHTAQAPDSVLIPGTERTISLLEVDASSKSILVFISPSPETVIPPDSVIVNVTRKKFIWLVWLGTVLVTAGGLMALLNSNKKN